VIRRSGDRSTQRIAQEAAKLIAVDGIADLHRAKLKAVERLGLSRTCTLPDNLTVEEALRSYQRIFQGIKQPDSLKAKREAAVMALRFFSAFEPLLVGSVLAGTADQRSPIELHLFCDSIEELDWFLEEKGIAAEMGSRAVYRDDAYASRFPSFSFLANGDGVEVTVFPLVHRRQAPFDRVTRQPMLRAQIEAVLKLL